MVDDVFEGKSRVIPSGRLSRLGVFGKLAGGVAGGVVAEGARRLASGERPQLSELLLTPGNITRVTEQLSQLRGAAMKLGQMISMDAGDMLPPELAAILGRLRDRAHHMPPAQLQQVLASHWGKDWRLRFARFGATPIAAASIGQVHKAVTHDGRTLAIKVQYPGVRASIDSDVDNVATLLRMTGMMPREIDIAPLLAEAKRQLHEEADYVREGAQMQRFAALLADDPGFVVPALDQEFTSGEVLAMSFVEGTAIENLVDAPQDERNRVMTALIRLVLRELFEFGLMQTDPNFANFRYQRDTGKLVLLDFGATRAVTPATAAGYRGLLCAGLDGDRGAVAAAAVAAGFLGEQALTRHPALIGQMIDIIIAEMNRPGAFDFGDRAFVGALRDQGMAIGQDRAAWHMPPIEMLFAQRKISGTALLAARLKAKVDVRAMIEPLRIG
ncbi:ABC1 kinase family protein [Sphingomonas sp. 28-63-12]|uniref:ABC1 kinase family protein n=1 Tax=Sphingomonas sp. 28-63-12 TaxID=1970434 RepID=UPI0035A93BF4